MSTVQDPPPAVSTPSITERLPFVITSSVFLKMLDAEVFEDDDRVELWARRIYEKMAKTQAHAIAANKANQALVRVLPVGWFPSNENPVKLAAKRVPLPDLVILRGEPDDYRLPPEPKDVGLIVEFSLTSLKHDTGEKLAAYAEAGIPAYWVLNLSEDVILVFERPVPSERRYESSQVIAVGQSVPLRLDGVIVAEIPALDLLPIRG